MHYFPNATELSLTYCSYERSDQPFIPILHRIIPLEKLTVEGDKFHQLCFLIWSIVNLFVGSVFKMFANILLASSDKNFGTLYSPARIFW